MYTVVSVTRLRGTEERKWSGRISRRIKESRYYTYSCGPTPTWRRYGPERHWDRHERSVKKISRGKREGDDLGVRYQFSFFPLSDPEKYVKL